MKKTLTILVMLVAVVWAAACTSSSNATSVSTNAGYDSQYREQSRSAQGYQQGQEPGTVEGDPPITLMMVGMETGQVYPGEDYYVYAIVDNPDNRDLEFEWSISNGEVLDVPEAERGRLATLIEDEKAAALAASAASTAPPGTETPAPAPGEATAPPAEGTPPGASTPAPGETAEGGAAPPAPPAQPIKSGKEPVAQAPPGAAKPSGVSTAPPVGAPSPGPAADTAVPTRSPSPGSNTNEQAVADTKSEIAARSGSAVAGSNADALSPREMSAYTKLIDKAKSTALTSEEQAQLDKLKRKLISAVPASRQLGNPMLLERRIVSGPTSAEGDEATAGEAGTAESAEAAEPVGETQASGTPAESGGEIAENATGLSSSAYSAVQAARAALAELNEVGSTSGTGNVADESSPKYRDGAENATTTGSVQAGADELRTEYRTWQDVSGTQRRRPLGSAIPESAEGPETAEDSFTEFSFITAEPFILWTPNSEGDLTIYVRAKFKEDVLTDVVELPVTVELREPKLTLSDEFPDMIHEDDNVLIRILGENIPEFFKGLITLTYDINALSFRDAELGEFFDDAPDAKLFDAQPDKTQGKVLLAVDANTELTQLSGTDPVLYLKFKAKQDITSQEQTALAIVTDSSASYILDYNGDNILPVPMERPVYKSEIIQPPALETYPRETPEGTPETGQQQPAAGQAAGTANQGPRSPGGQNPNLNPNPAGQTQQEQTTVRTGREEPPSRSQSTAQENVGPNPSPKAEGQQQGPTNPGTAGAGSENDDPQANQEGDEPDPNADQNAG